MRNRVSGFIQALVLLGMVGAASAQSLPDGRVSLVQDWSHRHVRYSNTGTLQQRVDLMKEPRALHNYLDRVWVPAMQGRMSSMTAKSPDSRWEATMTRPSDSPNPRRGSPFLPTRNKSKNSDIDWAVSLGTGGQFPTGETPAKYQFDVTKPPDCTNDFVVFPINATPSSTQANLIAINNLYSGTNPTGQCGTAPTVMWSYKVGSSGTALSPTLSIDGKKVAMLETANPVKLHVVTWQAGQGTSAAAPYSGTVSDVSLSYTTVAPTNTSCTNASAQDSNASPYIDYFNDGAFVSANNGILYHIKGIFKGTPTMDYCVQVGGATAAMTSPVYDQTVGKVFISDGASLYSVDFNPASGFSNKKSITVATGAGIILSPIIDGSSQMVYVFSATSAAGNFSMVSQIPYSLATHSDAFIGVNASGYVLDGAFDNNFYTSSDPTTWTLYACGRTAAGNTTPALYGITFNSSGVMNSTPIFGPNTTVNNGNTTGACSPLQEFYNNGDRMFVSTTGSSTVSMYDITNRLTGTTAPVAIATGYNGGTGSFAVDNTSTNAQASSIYFGTMGTSTTTCPELGAPVSLSEQTATNASSASGKTLSVSIPASPAGSMIVVGIIGESTSVTVKNVTDNGSGGANSYSQVSGARKTDSNAFSDMWVALKASHSATTVTITLSGNVPSRDAVVWVVNGFTNPVVDVVGTVAGGSQVGGTSTGASVTTTEPVEFIAALVNTTNQVTANPAPGNAFTSGGNITANSNAGASLITESAGTYQPAWTDSGSNFSEATVAFKESTTTSANYCAVKLTQSALK